ncbi:MAG: DUF2125 domain-containing protein [Caulobacteraceae bacterium]
MTSDTSPAPDLLSDPGPPRKKPRRLWLFAPYVVLLILAIGYCGFWFVAKLRIEQTLDARAEVLRKSGYVVAMDGRRIDGFPFRVRITLPEAQVAAPGGWAVGAAGLEAQAYLHGLDHWVLVAPQGLTVTRPRGGPMTVSGQALQASVVGLSGANWRIGAEGLKLTFTPKAGAAPFSLLTADRIDLNMKAGPAGANQALMLLQLQGGKAASGAVLHKLAGDAPVTGLLDLKATKANAFAGETWAAAAKAWSTADGQVEIVRGEMQGGDAAVWARGGALTAGRDGNLSGAVPLELRQAPKSLAALSDQGLDPEAAKTAAMIATARDQGGAASFNLVFQAGVTTLGPVKIGPAPKVF